MEQQRQQQPEPRKERKRARAQKRARARKRKTRAYTRHDAAFKKFYSQKAVIKSIFVDMCEFFGLDPRLAEYLDFDKAEPVSQESIDEFNLKGINDLVIKIPSRINEETGEPYTSDLWLVMEFQGEPQWDMPRRMMHYIDGLFARLFEQLFQEQGPTAPPPQIQGLVFFHGDEDWPGPDVPEMSIYDNNRPGMQIAGTHPEHRINLKSLNLDGFPLDRLVPAWCRIEQAKHEDEVKAVLKAVFTKYSEPEHDGLCRALYNRATMLKFFLRGRRKTPVPYKEARRDILGDEPMTYVTTVDRLIQEGEQKGERRGLQKGIAKGQRDQLCRLAAKQFNGRTSTRLKTLLKTIEDPAVLVKIGENLIDCNSGDEFIEAARAEACTEPPRPRARSL